MNIIRSEKLNVFDNIYDEYETLFKIDSTVTDSIPHIRGNISKA
jgi:hypothetical protein